MAAEAMESAPGHELARFALWTANSSRLTPSGPARTIPVMPVAAGGVDARALRSERARIIEALLDDVDALADAGVAAIVDEIPAYAAQDERFLADVREQVGAHYRAKLQLLLEGRTVTLDDIGFVRGAATRRARAGFALEDYLSAYRVGQQVLWEAFIGRAGPTPEGAQAAISLATPMMRYNNFVSARAARAYLEFEQYVVAEADRERRDLLEHLLAGELPSRGPLQAAAHAYGLGADTRMTVAAAVPVGPDLDNDAPHSAGVGLARAGLTDAKTLVVVRQAEIVAVLPLTAERDERGLCDRLDAVQERLRHEGVPLAIGVSTVAQGVAALPRAYAEARAALECADEDGGLSALPRLSPFQ